MLQTVASTCLQVDDIILTPGLKPSPPGVCSRHRAHQPEQTPSRDQPLATCMGSCCQNCVLLTACCYLHKVVTRPFCSKSVLSTRPASPGTQNKPPTTAGPGDVS